MLFRSVTKVTRRHNEANSRGRLEGLGLGEVEVGVEVICDLGKDTCPVDGVDGGEAVRLVDLGIGEESLDKVLR